MCIVSDESEKPDIKTVTSSEKPDIETVTSSEKPDIQTVTSSEKPDIKTITSSEQPDNKTMSIGLGVSFVALLVVVLICVTWRKQIASSVKHVCRP